MKFHIDTGLFDIYPAHRWFAWHPVQLDDDPDRRWVWLETVWRWQVSYGGSDPDISTRHGLNKPSPRDSVYNEADTVNDFRISGVDLLGMIFVISLIVGCFI